MERTFIQLQNEHLQKAIGRELLMVKNSVEHLPFPSLACFSDIKLMNYRKRFPYFNNNIYLVYSINFDGSANAATSRASLGLLMFKICLLVVSQL